MAIPIAIAEGKTIAKATAEGKTLAKAIAEDKIKAKRSKGNLMWNTLNSHIFLTAIYFFLISRPGQSQGLLYKHLCQSLIHWCTAPALVKIFTAPSRPNGLKWCFQSKNKLYWHFSEILNLPGHLNCSTGTQVMAILLNGWILTTGGVASGRVCPAACAADLFESDTQSRAIVCSVDYRNTMYHIAYKYTMD